MDNLIPHTRVCKLLGYERPGDAERYLNEQGIKPFKARPGFWFVTLDQLNAARGIVSGQQPEETVLI